MANGPKSYRFLVSRRASQAAVLGLFIGGNVMGWDVLKGNLSSAVIFGMVPLSDPFHVLQIAAAGFLPAADALIGAAIVLLAYGMVAGRAFCGWICPVNIVTDAANWLGDRLPIRGLSLRRSVRYWIMGMSILISPVAGVAAFEWISPVSMLHRGVVYGMGMGWIIIGAIFLFDALSAKNGFCGHMCPLGAFYALAGRYSILRPVHVLDKCTNCGKCVKVCSEPQVLALIGRESGAVRSGECINCGRCIDVCGDGAIRFGTRFARQ